MSPRFARLDLCLFVSVVLGLAGCDKDNGGPPKPRGDAPPPSAAAAAPSGSAQASRCASPGPVKDSISAAFFPASSQGFCIDPQGEAKTYGDKGKLTLEEVCTTAFDGECEVYKQFGLKRVVRFDYVDGKGAGGNVEVTLAQFDTDAGAYGMFTKRVVAGDPAEKGAPRALAAKAQGAIGTGRAYVFRGVHLVELQYNNERETPEQLAKSSDAILTALGKDIGDKLPGAADKPALARALPETNLITGGIEYFTKEPMGISGLAAPGAVGYYKDGDKRWRGLAIGAHDADQAKDIMKSLLKRPGSLPIKDVGDEAVHIVVQAGKDAPKVEALIARKGALVTGVADEEYLLKGPGADQRRLSKEDAVAKAKLMLQGAAPVPAGSASAAPKK
jgi:hypothetical protein